MLDPLAPLIAPLWVIPVFPPAVPLVAVTEILLPPEVIVIAPKVTLVVGLPDAIPFKVMDLAVIKPS